VDISGKVPYTGQLHIHTSALLMSAPELDVRYTAQLARIQLTEEEIAAFQTQLADILRYVEQLEKLNIEGVEPTAHANPIFDVLRQDDERPGLSQEAALKNAPRQANGLFIVPKVIE
jgi:aspartyl-tRNA(Asn)/glutamyl-tRNA(Gln) amidotransferase subunit C